MTDHVILNHDQVTWTKPKLASPSPHHTTPGRHFTFLLGAAKLLALALPGDIGKKILKIIWKPFDTVKRQRKQKLLYSFSSHLSGEEFKKQLRAFDLKPNDDCEGVILQQVLQEFDKYFLDYQNEMFASFKFLEIKQEQGEKFTNYYSRLRNAVVECNYGESQDRMLRDKLIQGLLDKALQERLIRVTSKKARALQEVVSECKTAENSKIQASVMNEKFTVNALKNSKNYRKQ
ncbi:reverse transcriptase domain-containing protein [Trichonephila clavipes]|uniref:Reverse transcriptase domain-containing protein n=1 Tax=Trichonephila clavipes TaxID=2585209 RepID=A0A8X6V198_TRICX|nr:reverse transcriptase domain-containing protein [Trichonephila clavipes]